MNSLLQVRTDRKTKDQARKILESLGLDLSAAVNLYLVQIVKRKGIPFQIVTENGFLLEEELKMLREEAWALKHGKRYSSAKAAMKDILGK